MGSRRNRGATRGLGDERKEKRLAATQQWKLNKETKMRVKIEGRITVERLAQALQEAAKIYERACPGHAIYGANLYLNAYRADGLQFGIASEKDKTKEMMITMKAPPGDLIKPALTSEAKASREAAVQKQKEAHLRSANVITAHLIEWKPEEFINGVNRAIQDAWKKVNPSQEDVDILVANDRVPAPRKPVSRAKLRPMKGEPEPA